MHNLRVRVAFELRGATRAIHAAIDGVIEEGDVLASGLADFVARTDDRMRIIFQEALDSLIGCSLERLRGDDVADLCCALCESLLYSKGSVRVAGFAAPRAQSEPPRPRPNAYQAGIQDRRLIDIWIC